MSWEEARNREITRWSAIRDAIGTAAPVDLLTEINTASTLCDKAKGEAGESLNYCDRCLFYQQFGGCREVSGRMSERVAESYWQGLQTLVDGFIAHLRALEIPSAAVSPAG